MAIIPNGNSIIVENILLSVICSAAVSLRFATLRIVKTGIHADDVWTLIALALLLAREISEAATISVALHATSKADPPVVRYLKTSYILAVFYFITMACAKTAVLCYYRRIFPTQNFKRATMIMFGVVILWVTPAFFAELLTCSPPAAWWNPHLKGKCIDYPHFWVTIMSFEVIIDSVILALPIREVVKLQMPMRRKLLVSCIFSLGGFVVISNIVRLGFAYQAGNPNLNLSHDLLWGNIHTGTAIVCICLPTYRPLLRHISQALSRAWSSYSKRSLQRHVDDEVDLKDLTARAKFEHV